MKDMKTKFNQNLDIFKENINIKDAVFGKGHKSNAKHLHYDVSDVSAAVLVQCDI